MQENLLTYNFRIEGVDIEDIACVHCCEECHSLRKRSEAEFMNVQFCWGFWELILRVHRFEVSVYYVYITNQFQPTFAHGGGGEGGGNRLVEVIVNSKEENS